MNNNQKNKKNISKKGITLCDYSDESEHPIPLESEHPILREKDKNFCV